jgi:hypothetical protein
MTELITLLILMASWRAVADGAVEGFTMMELVATLSGEPLYRACGFVPYEKFIDDRGGAGVPLLRMRKSL